MRFEYSTFPLSTYRLFGCIVIPYIDAEKLHDPTAEVAVDPKFVQRLTKRADELKSQLVEETNQY